VKEAARIEACATGAAGGRMTACRSSADARLSPGLQLPDIAVASLNGIDCQAES